jgi:hypothetical protein
MAQTDLAVHRAGVSGRDVLSEAHDYAGRRSKLTARAVGWATDALSHDDTTVSGLARHLGVDWHTAWTAIKVEATRRAKRPRAAGRSDDPRGGRAHLAPLAQAP